MNSADAGQRFQISIIRDHSKVFGREVISMYLVIDIGGTFVKYALMDAAANIKP